MIAQQTVSTVKLGQIMWCNDCMVQMEAVFKNHSDLLGGWVCPKCARPEVAIGRERKFTRETLEAEENKITAFDPDNMPEEWHERTKRDHQDFIYSLSPVA